MLHLIIISTAKCIADLLYVSKLTYNKTLGVQACLIKDYFVLFSNNPDSQIDIFLAYNGQRLRFFHNLLYF